MLREPVSPAKALGALLLAVGTLWMIDKRDPARTEPEHRLWLPYAVGSAVFASLTAILGKVGIAGVARCARSPGENWACCVCRG